METFILHAILQYQFHSLGRRTDEEDVGIRRNVQQRFQRGNSVRKEFAELLPAVRYGVDALLQPLIQIFSKFWVGLRRANSEINIVHPVRGRKPELPAQK